MTETYRLRVAYLLARKGTVVVLALLLVSVLAAGVAGYTYTRSEEVQTVTERTHVQTVHLTASDSARVQTTTALWTAGTRLRDRPVYLRDSMPNLTVTARTSVPKGTDVVVRQRISLKIQATVNGEPLWSTTRPLATQKTTVSDGRMTTRATITIAELGSRLRELQEGIAAPLSFSLHLAVRTQYDTGRYTGTLSTAAPLSIKQETYAVGAFQPAKQTHAQQVKRARRTGTTLTRRTIVSGAVALLALLGAITAAVGRRRLDDSETLQQRLTRAKFDEWISTGKVPDNAGKTTVSVGSLPDLVDIAIDSNRRVIHDEWRGVYAVIVDDTVYEYAESADLWDQVELPD